MLVGHKKKSQKFDLSTFNYKLYDSNPCSSLGVMKFQKWELFSGSSGIISDVAFAMKNGTWTLFQYTLPQVVLTL